MGKIVIAEFMSLDGVIEAPHTWHFPYMTDDMTEHAVQQILEADAFLYGRKTYEEFAGFWSTQVNNEFGFADKLNAAPKYVVSTTLESADWNNSTLIKSNVIEEIKRLKQEISGIISMTGSATLIQSLMQENLIDEYQLMIHPIVVGKGVRLFKDGLNTLPLKLVSTRVFDGGVILAIHHPAEQE
jgi:dihydrofolate reductase